MIRAPVRRICDNKHTRKKTPGGFPPGASSKYFDSYYQLR
jgi:hypothetical protein